MPSKKAPLKFPLTVPVEMTLAAIVTVTQEVADGIADQYPDAWRENQHDPEELAKMMLYASVNPRIPADNANFEDIWDGVADMRGLIKAVELF